MQFTFFSKHDSSRVAGLAEFLVNNANAILVSAGIPTILLILPVIFMAPEDQASQDPPGEIIDLQREVDDSFQPITHRTAIIVESRTGDVLTQAALWELYQNTQKLLRADLQGEQAPDGLPVQPYLYTGYNPRADHNVVGLVTVADAVQQVLASVPLVSATLEKAGDELVKLAIATLLVSPESGNLAGALSVNASPEKRLVFGHEVDYWTSPALVFDVLADNEKL